MGRLQKIQDVWNCLYKVHQLLEKRGDGGRTIFLEAMERVSVGERVILYLWRVDAVEGRSFDNRKVVSDPRGQWAEPLDRWDFRSNNPLPLDCAFDRSNLLGPAPPPYHHLGVVPFLGRVATLGAALFGDRRPMFETKVFRVALPATGLDPRATLGSSRMVQVVAEAVRGTVGASLLVDYVLVGSTSVGLVKAEPVRTAVMASREGPRTFLPLGMFWLMAKVAPVAYLTPSGLLAVLLVCRVVAYPSRTAHLTFDHLAPLAWSMMTYAWFSLGHSHER